MSNSTVQMTAKLPTAYSQQQRQAAFNNAYASAVASGDPRFNAKAYDRAGLSRAGGQWNQAGIDGAAKMSEGIANAYSQDLQNNQYNSATALQGQQAQESNALALNALQQQNNYANQMAALQRQGMAMNLASSLLGGLMR
jgi:hypothetical protein